MRLTSRWRANIRDSWDKLRTGLRFTFGTRKSGDHVQRILPSNLTPANISTYLSKAGQGDLAGMADVYDVMPAMDPAIRGARRQLVAGILATEWRLTPGDSSDASKQIAQELEADLKRPDTGFAAVLEALIDGTLRGTAIVEVVWNAQTETRRPLKFLPIAQQRHRVNPDTGELGISESKGSSSAVALSDPSFAKGKFISYSPGLPMDPSLWGTYRSILNDFLGRLNAMGWWTIRLERYGVGILTGEYTDEPGRQSMEDAAAGFGAAGAFFGPAGSKLSVFEPSIEAPHPRYLEETAKRIAIAINGQTQTTDIAKGSGSKASAQVHRLVQKDVLVDTWRQISDVLERDLLVPWLRMRALGGVACPKFTPDLDEAQDVAALGAGAKAWAELIPLSPAQLYEMSGFAQPAEGEVPVTFSQPAPAPAFGPAPASENVVPFRAAARKPDSPPQPKATPRSFGQSVEESLAPFVAHLEALPDDARLEALIAGMALIPAAPPAPLVQELQAVRLDGMLSGIKRVNAGRPTA